MFFDVALASGPKPPPRKELKHSKVCGKGGGAVFSFSFSVGSKVSRAWGVPRCGGVLKGHWGVLFFLGVAGRKVLRPWCWLVDHSWIHSSNFLLTFWQNRSAKLKKGSEVNVYIYNIYIYHYTSTICRWRENGKEIKDMFQKTAPSDWFETVSHRSKLFSSK